MWSKVSGNNFRHISSLFADIKNVKSFEKLPIFYNGILVGHGNICYVILINEFFIRHIVYVQSIFAPILRSIGN